MLPGGRSVRPSGRCNDVFSGTADDIGNITFVIEGGGCIDPDDFSGPTYIAQVRADGVVLSEICIVSPDAVNGQGTLPSLTNNCEDGTTVVGLSDAVFHTRAIKLGEREVCTKSNQPFFGNGSEVHLGDAVNLTPFIKNSNFCVCQE